MLKGSRTGGLIHSYRELGRNPDEDAESHEVLAHEFIEKFAVSFPAIIRSFPKDNLDINALEAHMWDKLLDYYPYKEFGRVKVESEAELKFFRQAVELIQQWFYKGDWTSCLVEPSEQEIADAVKGHRKNFVKNVRVDLDTPNLGRDGLWRPLPDFLAEAKDHPKQAYRDHAFKLFHGPAGVINTLTSIQPTSSLGVNLSEFKGFIRRTQTNMFVRFKEWGYNLPKPGSEDMRVNGTPEEVGNIASSINSGVLMGQDAPYARVGSAEDFKRLLFFIKTSMMAAELIRRTGQGGLTKENFNEIMKWMSQQPSDVPHQKDLFRFNFATSSRKTREFGKSSIMHANKKELPAALFAVDYIQKNRR